MNLDIKPNNGGIPAKESIDKTINMDIICKLPKNFKSFKFLMYLRSNKKKIKKKLINIKIYEKTLNKNTEKK